MIVGQADRPSGGGRVPCDRNVPAEADDDAVIRCLCCGASRAIRRQSLRGRAEVELDPGGNPGLPAFAVDFDPSPGSGRCGGDVDEVAVAQADERERAVVARQPKCLADGGVDRSAGGRGRSQGNLERVQEVWADLHLFAGGPVQADELGVVAKAAAGAVDRLELGLEFRSRPVERLGPANGDERGRSQRTQRR